MWLCCRCGQLGGRGGRAHLCTHWPSQMAALLQVLQVVTGGMHTMALTDDFQVWTTGVNDEGALGRPTGESCGRCVSDATPQLLHGGLQAPSVQRLCISLLWPRPAVDLAATSRMLELMTKFPIPYSGPAPPLAWSPAACGTSTSSSPSTEESLLDWTAVLPCRW